MGHVRRLSHLPRFLDQYAKVLLVDGPESSHAPVNNDRRKGLGCKEAADGPVCPILTLQWPFVDNKSVGG
eukprot:6525018-Karenia_brevis.AAC.1